MNQAQFGRFIRRVGLMLEYVPDPQESQLMHLLRASLHKGNPSRDAQVALAREINRMYLYLGEVKSRELNYYARACHVEITEHMVRADADRLWEYLTTLYRDWEEEGIPS